MTYKEVMAAMNVPLGTDGLPDVPLMVERGISVTRALEIWGQANRHRETYEGPEIREGSLQ